MSDRPSNPAIDALYEQGYCRLDQLIAKKKIDSALQLTKFLHNKSSHKPIKSTPSLDQGQEIVYNLQNKSIDLLKLVIGNESIKAILNATLNDQWHKAIPLNRANYILRSFLARNNQAATPMHIDSYIPYQGDFPLSIQVSIILEDQNKDNGCTILVPKSHQSGEYVDQIQRDKAIALESNAGDVIIWDSRIWHGTGENKTGVSRWSLIATFVRWWIKQGYQITEQLPDKIYQELDNEQKAIMGFCSRPMKDEYEGIDFKTGFSNLPSKLPK